MVIETFISDKNDFVLFCPGQRQNGTNLDKRDKQDKTGHSGQNRTFWTNETKDELDHGEPHISVQRSAYSRG
jgi:hypothetical protein